MNFIREMRYNGLSTVRYYNSGREVPSSELWTTRFLESRGLTGSLKKPISITSVFGPVRHCRTDRKGLNIFYTGENLHSGRFNDYEKYLNGHHFALTLGFDIPEKEDYLRFPYWILHKFDPTSDYDAIVTRVKEISARPTAPHPLFCSLVSRHDEGGQRAGIADALSSLGPIVYGGKFRHNDDSLVKAFNDDKITFLRQFQFNICPENSDTPGYVTEKLFDAFEAGCVPIYWGAAGNPEPGLINKDAILFWDGNAQKLQDSVRHLLDGGYEEFIQRPVFSSDAPDIIWSHFVTLEKAIKERL